MNRLLLTTCLISFFTPVAKTVSQAYQHDALMQTLDAILAKRLDTAQEAKEACKEAFKQKNQKEKIEIFLSYVTAQPSVLSEEEAEKTIDILLRHITTSSSPLSEKEKIDLVRFLFSVYQKNNSGKTETNEQLEIKKQIFKIMKSPVNRVKKYERNKHQMLVLG